MAPPVAGAAAAWDAEYAAGRYAYSDPPVDFVRDIVAKSGQRGLRHGLYVGCGNGRNLLLLLEAGLDLTGLDISRGGHRAIAGPAARPVRPADHRRSVRAAPGGSL